MHRVNQEVANYLRLGKSNFHKVMHVCMFMAQRPQKGEAAALFGYFFFHFFLLNFINTNQIQTKLI